MNTLAVNMIIGNRKEEYLEYALKSTAWADEHVIVNTGDENNPNIPIAKAILPKAKFLNFSETNLPFTFSNARNYALDNSESYWILWQDADEVHFNVLEEKFRMIAHWNHYDAFCFYFYHFLLDVFHYQHLEERKNIFRRDGRRWTGDVHEQVQPIINPVIIDYTYHHYGYTKPQKEIYENWRLYWSLNPDEQYKLQENRNPHDIITDRVTVANAYDGFYPEVIQEFIKKQKPKVKDYKLL